MKQGPAYSAAFEPGSLEPLRPTLPLEGVTPEWAWGESTGAGVKVAIVDSGIDAAHPAVGGSIAAYLQFHDVTDGLEVDWSPHDDVSGHGTACAGIIRSLAPDCELYSIRILGPRLTGRGAVFVAALQMAAKTGIDVCNLSLGTTVREFEPILREIVDQSYFQNMMMVTAANNMPIPSFPSVFSSVISVAAHEGKDPYCFYYNPHPPVEFGAPGIDIRVPWKDGQWITATGNSFAAPHITGIITRILSKHPGLTLFEIKTILRALAANMVRDDGQST